VVEGGVALRSGIGVEYDPAALPAAAGRLGLRRIVLFGSRATGDPFPTESSDVDIAISRSNRAGGCWSSET
jgi:predicted nucleotidyltransferase